MRLLNTSSSYYYLIDSDFINVVDYSEDDMGQILEIYSESQFGNKVKIYRNEKNLGLIKSRLKGIRLSRGEVFFFMDSHSEVQERW